MKARRTGKREHEYEVVWEGDGREDSWHTRTEILQMGYKKLLDEKDQQIAAESMLGQRKLKVNLMLLFILTLSYTPYQLERRQQRK